MSLLDLWRLVKRFWWLVIGLPVLFAVCFYAWMHFGAQEGSSSYSASGNVVVNSGVKTAAGIAKTETEQISIAYPGVSATCSPDYNLNCLSITVTANDREVAAEALTEVTDNIVSRSRELLKGADSASDMLVFDAVTDLSAPVAHAERVSKKTLLLAPVAGLFAAALIIVIIFLSRRPLLGADDAEALTDLPVLDLLPLDDGGRRLVANADFVCDQPKARRYCLIPVGPKDQNDIEEVAKAIATVLQEGDEFDSCSILSGHEAVGQLDEQREGDSEAIIACCDSLQHSIDGARIAQKYDVTILLARQWDDSSRYLEAAMIELQLAKAPSIGLLYRTK